MKHAITSTLVVALASCHGDGAADPVAQGDTAGMATSASGGAAESSTGSVVSTESGGADPETTSDAVDDSSSDDTSTGADGPTVPTDDADNLAEYDEADAWNFPSDNYFVCGTLARGAAPLRYADFAPISARGDYSITDALDSNECAAGQVRFDLHEILQTTEGRLLFHKGGQGYDDPSTPYGHLWIADLQSPAPSPQVSGEPPEYGTPSKIPGTGEWDWTNRNGRGCEPSGDFDYLVHIVPQGDADELPPTWQYKPNATSSRFNKYADAGPEQAEGTAHHAYLLWSWLHRGDGETKSAGGGQVRVLLRDGQVFHRCAVDSIDSIAYAKDSSDEAGRVTAIYGKTRASVDGPWVYGWTIHSHRAKQSDGEYGPRVYHMLTCAASGC